MSQLSLFQETFSWQHKSLRGDSSALFSEDRRYRYELRRTWDPSKRPLVACCLNPSKSDEGSVDDATTKRLIDFANDWGLGGLVLLNCYALMSTNPRALRTELKAGRDPIGALNDETLRRAFDEYRGDRLIVAWGGNATLLDRGDAVARMALDIHGNPECFGMTRTKTPAPRHPLYISSITVPVPMRDCLAETIRKSA